MMNISENVMKILKESKKFKLSKLEELASLEHEQWMYWAASIKKELLRVLEDDRNIKADIQKRLDRWKDCFVPYSELSEKMKDFDREWATKVLELVEIK